MVQADWRTGETGEMANDETSGGRPDVIVIMTDQHRFDHVGFGGNTVVATPNLDALAARSVVLDRAYVANPICMPNRSTILTGLMPSVHGTRFNGIALDPNHWTFVRSLRSAGYRSVLVGKGHFQNMGNGAELIAAFTDQRPEPDAYTPSQASDWDTWELRQRYDDESAEHTVPPDFYGFDHVELTVEHADIAGGHYARWLRDKGVDIDTTQGRSNALSTSDLWNQIWKPKCGEELYTTTYIAERAIAAINATPADRPLMMQCSFPDPHHPFTAPGRYHDMYAAADMELPESFDDPHEHSMKHHQRSIANRGKQAFPVLTWAPSEDQFRAALAAQYGAITMIDDAVGQVLAALEAAGRTNAIVVFTSDHGDMFGDHGLLLKGASHYAGCLRVPLTFAAPGLAPTRVNALATHVDLGSTILDLAGVPDWVGHQGHSIAPMLRGENDKGGAARESLLVEEDQIADIARLGRPLRMRTVITDQFRYTRYDGSPDGELFDLINDPGEMFNLFDADSSSRLQREAQECLVTTLIDTAERTRRPTHLA
jgi:arylsulfatase A-like enzyme